MAQAIRVLHIDTEREWGGGEEQLVLTVLGLAERGFDNLIVAQPNSPLSFRAQEEGIPLYETRMRGEFDLAASLRIAGLVRKGKVAIIHAHTAHAAFIGFIAKKLSPDAKLIVHRRVALPIRFRFKYRSADMVVAISKPVSLVLREAGVPEERIRIIPDGIPFDFNIDLNNLSFLLDRLKVRGCYPIIGSIGRLSPLKGFRYLIEAAEEVVRNYPDAKFLIAGEGKGRGELEALVRRKGLTHSVRFLGFISNIYEFLSLVDIFVLPSLSEGLNTSLLKAMALGKPIIATRVGGVVDVITDGKEGVLIPPKDSSAIAKAVLALLSSKERAKEMGFEGRERAREFSIEKTIDETARLYYELMGDGK
ncbi:MAG: glycosyltransferase [Acidobacteria bacterium]|nr:glycosyltransferase [Acidobacteriota bacterium]